VGYLVEPLTFKHILCVFGWLVLKCDINSRGGSCHAIWDTDDASVLYMFIHVEQKENFWVTPEEFFFYYYCRNVVGTELRHL